MVERHHVRFTLSALADLDEIGTYHAGLRGLDDAEALLGELRRHVARLDQFPLRGPIPKELGRTDRTDIRQTMLGRHRIFYIVNEGEVAVFLIADGRRNMAALLDTRLLDPDPPR